MLVNARYSSPCVYVCTCARRGASQSGGRVKRRASVAPAAVSARAAAAARAAGSAPPGARTAQGATFAPRSPIDPACTRCAHTPPRTPRQPRQPAPPRCCSSSAPRPAGGRASPGRSWGRAGLIWPGRVRSAARLIAAGARTARSPLARRPTPASLSPSTSRARVCTSCWRTRGARGYAAPRRPGVRADGGRVRRPATAAQGGTTSNPPQPRPPTGCRRPRPRSHEATLLDEVEGYTPDQRLTLATNLGCVALLVSFVECLLGGEDPLGEEHSAWAGGWRWRWWADCWRPQAPQLRRPAPARTARPRRSTRPAPPRPAPGRRPRPAPRRHDAQPRRRRLRRRVRAAAAARERVRPQRLRQARVPRPRRAPHRAAPACRAARRGWVARFSKRAGAPEAMAWAAESLAAQCRHRYCSRPFHGYADLLTPSSPPPARCPRHVCHPAQRAARLCGDAAPAAAAPRRQGGQTRCQRPAWPRSAAVCATSSASLRFPQPTRPCPPASAPRAAATRSPRASAPRC
jgi:hypothetical protein